MAVYQNKVFLIGYAGSDPETHNFEGGGMVTNISIATTRSWKKKGSEEWSEETTWHRLVFYSRFAQAAADQLHKGSRVSIEGYIRSRKVEDKYYTDIVVDKWINLDPKGSTFDSDRGPSRSDNDRGEDRSSGTTQEGGSVAETTEGGPMDGFADPDDDLPF